MAMAKIIIETMPPEKMRLEAYREPGCGDWHWDQEGNLHVQIACSGDLNVWDDLDSFAVAVHELVEARFAFAHGVTAGAVDAFDVMYEKERATGLHGPDDEPGEDARSPYRKEHADAMIIEGLIRRFLAAE